MKLPSKKIVFRIAGLSVLVLLYLGVAGVLIPINQARVARFRIDALARIITSHFLTSGQQLTSLSEFPDFHVVSHFDSISFTRADLNRGVIDGYVYDMHYLGDRKYVISASPIGMFASRIEFGMTHHRRLKINGDNVDVHADGLDEVLSWPVAMRYDRISTYSAENGSW